MDKKIALAAALAASFAGSALAADLPSKKAPVAAPPVMSWTGFYVGANAGGAWSGNNSGSLKVYGGAPALSAIPVGNKVFNNYGGFLGGGQVGYNYQLMQSFVIGAEADIQGLAGNSGTANFTGFSSGNGTSYTTVGKASSNLQYIGTVRGRVGYLVMPTLLAYGTAGFAYGGVSSTVWLATSGNAGATGGGGSLAYSNTQAGCSCQTGRQRLSISTTASQTAMRARQSLTRSRQMHGPMASARRAPSTATLCVQASTITSTSRQRQSSQNTKPASSTKASKHKLASQSLRRQNFMPRAQ